MRAIVRCRRLPVPRAAAGVTRGPSRLSCLWFTPFRRAKQTIAGHECDNATNVPNGVVSKIGRDLHRQEGHPLNRVKSIVEAHFEPHGFTFHDDLSPVVPAQASFDDLLVPQDHPSRQPSDTYYVNSNHVLRPHCTAHDPHLLRSGETAFLVTGDVYRRDTVDATHYPVFHQIDGVRVFHEEELCAMTQSAQPTEGACVQAVEANMKETLEGVAKTLFGTTVETRWVTESFPFTTPSWELEVRAHRDADWLEVLGCGLLRRPILSTAGVPSTSVAWAFGLGLERLAMVMYAIPDIRLFWTQDDRFTRQFDARIPLQQRIRFQSYSKYPLTSRDISFWIGDDGLHEYAFHEVVRNIGGDLVELVHLVDRFKHPKTGRESVCYRIDYRSMDRSLTSEDVNVIQDRIREEIPKALGVTLR